MHPRFSAFIEAVAVVAMLAYAGLLRMGWVGISPFAYDEARVSLLALQMSRGGPFPVIGLPSSAGLPNFPATVWIFAIPYALSSDPRIATLFVGSLGVLAVAGIWWLARRAWGPWASLSAGLLAASSPYLILYSRSVWGQNLLPVLAVLWAITGSIAITNRAAWAVAGHFFLAGFTFQVHYGGLALVPGTVLLSIYCRWWRFWRAALMGGIAALCLALPFLIAAFWQDPGIGREFRRLLEQSAQVDLAGFQHLITLALGWDWEWLLTGAAATPASPAVKAITAGVIGLLLGIGSIALIATPSRGLAALLLVWAMAGPLLFLRHTTPSYIHYQLVSLPALLLVAGAAAKLSPYRWWGPAVTLTCLLIGMAQSLPVAWGLTWAGKHASPDGMGTPLYWPMAAANALKDGRPVVVLSSGDNPATDADAAMFEVLLWGYPHRIVDGRWIALIPDQPAHILATDAVLSGWQAVEASGLVKDVQALPRRQGEPPYMTALATAKVGSFPDGFQAVAGVDLANGVRFRGWRFTPMGSRWRFSTYWEILGPVTGERYHQFHHLRWGDDGPVVGNYMIFLSPQRPGKMAINCWLP